MKRKKPTFWPRFAAVLVVTGILQAGVIDALAAGMHGLRPDLMLVVLVFFAVYTDSHTAIIASFATGFAADLIGPSMGPSTISLGLLGTILSGTSRFLSLGRMHHQAATVFITALCAGILTRLLSSFQGQTSLENIWVDVTGTAFFSCIVGPALFIPLARWMKVKTG